MHETHRNLHFMLFHSIINSNERLCRGTGNMNLREYTYTLGKDLSVDREFQQGTLYGKVKLGSNHLFWKNGLRWYVLNIAKVERTYRRVEEVRSKICCGNANFDMQKLALILIDGKTLFLLVSEGNEQEAKDLYQALKENHPELKFGKDS